VKAIFYNLLAWAILPFMDTIAKYLSSDLSFFQITWARYFFTVFFTLPFMFLFFRKNLTWSTQPKLQIFRGLTLFFANILFFYSISIISMAKALTLAFVAPLITTALSPKFLNEQVGFRRWSAVIVGFLGCLVVIRPGFLDFNLATIAALGTGCSYGVYLVITRSLHSTDPPFLTLLLTGVVGLTIGSFFVPLVWEPPTTIQWLWMCLMGLFACLGHIYLSDIIKNICPKQANKPIKHIHSHCMVVGGSQTSGTKKDPMVSPTTPVNKRVKNGGSVE
jgi:drug/metabolite transporter (DMT)-like permease